MMLKKGKNEGDMMIKKKKVIVFDVDGTLCLEKKYGEKYDNVIPNLEVIKSLRRYKKKGFYIILNSSRNMNSFDGNVGKINAVTLKTLLKWLDKNSIPHDEIHMGKPWCGTEGFNVDDKTIRPSEFLSNSYEGIRKMLAKEKKIIAKRSG